MSRNFCASPAGPTPLCCPTCGFRLHAGARFCSACGTVQATPAQHEAATIRSQFGASSADLAELLSARGDVFACPRCDALNKTSAAYCGHCGQRLATADSAHRATPVDEAPRARESHRAGPDAPIRPAARPRRQSARRYGSAIVLTLLGVVSLAAWQWNAPAVPAKPATESATLHSLPAPLPASPLPASPLPASPLPASPLPAASVAIAEPVEPVPTVEPADPIALLIAAQSPAPGIDPEEQAQATPPVPPPAATHRRMPPREEARKKEVVRTAMRRTAAPTAVDELYRRRAAERCAEGMYGLVCREALRFELCEGKWSREARSGMTICRLNG
ncbi:MAG: zinc ribbon domain-containing protein [Proteobacteria bacterium]|nr:zinc ribbon domain-containing protein [Pseudomonadota bacterium]MBS0551097.1 zinc ribbon domain-containing protein [Pseudomonadota bacterium]